MRLSAFSQDGKTYFAPEPRFSTRYQLTNHWTVQAGLSRMIQYLHRVNASGFSTPDDLWLPASAEAGPQRSWQLDAGWEYRSSKGIKLGLEAYYKKMDDLLSFGNTVPFLDDDDEIEDSLVVGKGWAYGLELSLKKEYGRTGGWLAYTWSKTFREFAGTQLKRVFPGAF